MSRRPRKATGIGRRLLTALIREAEARDFRLMVAVIGDAESHGSIGLHRSLGFEMVGSLPGIGYKHGRWLASVLMQSPLGPGTGRRPRGFPSRNSSDGKASSAADDPQGLVDDPQDGCRARCRA